MTIQALIDRLAEALEPVLGAVITNLVIRIAIREASIDLSPEDKAQLESNRTQALAARADDILRAQ